MNRLRRQGWTLLELLVTVAVFGLIAVLVTPALLTAWGGTRMRLAAAEVASSMHMARRYAIRHSAKVGLKFDPDAAGGPSWTLYRDGDGDGVLTRDIERGVDPPVAGGVLRRLASHAWFGFPPGPRPPTPATRAVASTGSTTRSVSTSPTSPPSTRSAPPPPAPST